MTGPRVEKLVLVAPNPSGSPVPALVLVYLVEDDEVVVVVVVDGLVLALLAPAAAAEEEVDAVDDGVTEKSLLAGKNGFGTIEVWRCRVGQMHLTDLRIIMEFIVIVTVLGFVDFGLFWL